MGILFAPYMATQGIQLLTCFKNKLRETRHSNHIKTQDIDHKLKRSTDKTQDFI